MNHTAMLCLFLTLERRTFCGSLLMMVTPIQVVGHSSVGSGGRGGVRFFEVQKRLPPFVGGEQIPPDKFPGKKLGHEPLVVEEVHSEIDLTDDEVFRPHVVTMGFKFACWKTHGDLTHLSSRSAQRRGGSAAAAPEHRVKRVEAVSTPAAAGRLQPRVRLHCGSGSLSWTCAMVRIS